MMVFVSKFHFWMSSCNCVVFLCYIFLRLLQTYVSAHKTRLLVLYQRTGGKQQMEKYVGTKYIFIYIYIYIYIYTGRYHEILKNSIVFGAWGEASPDVERLISVLAENGSFRHWHAMLAPSSLEARDALAWMLRRRWAMTALGENARLNFERMEFVGRGAAAAAARREVGDGAVARRRACSFWRGPRLYGAAGGAI